jgi:crotonobetainyl-CoA:carnitine CoA-transferase CaiB-like acyl-CoA transferase
MWPATRERGGALSGIALDLSQPGGREVLNRLLPDADVLVENFLPGTMHRWGLGYEETLARRYPERALLPAAREAVCLGLR